MILNILKCTFTLVFIPFLTFGQGAEDIGLTGDYFPKQSISFNDHSSIEIFTRGWDERYGIIFDSNGTYIKSIKLNPEFRSTFLETREYSLVSPISSTLYSLELLYGVLTIYQTNHDLTQNKLSIKAKNFSPMNYLNCFFNEKGNPCWVFEEIKKKSELVISTVELDLKSNTILKAESIITTLGIFDEYANMFVAGNSNDNTIYGLATNLRKSEKFKITLFTLKSNQVEIVKTFEDEIKKGYSFMALSVREVVFNKDVIRFSIALTENPIGGAYVKSSRPLGFKTYELYGEEIKSMEFWTPKGMTTNDFLFLRLCHFRKDDQSYYYTEPKSISQDGSQSYGSIVYEYNADDMKIVSENIVSSYPWENCPLMFNCFDDYFGSDATLKDRREACLIELNDSYFIIKHTNVGNKDSNILVETLVVKK